MSGQILFKPPRNWEAILFVNCLFDLVTCRLYRFWARTRLRQCFFGAVLIDGEPLEYCGKPHELLAGFALSFAVVAPLLAAAIALAAPADPDSVAFLLLSNLLCVAAILFFGAASFCARRYLASRLVWRGIGAGQEGRILVYAFLYLKWGAAFVLTAGHSVPRACAELARYRWSSTRWGSLRGAFAGSDRVLQSDWQSIWAIHILPVFALGAWTVVDSGGHLVALQWELEHAFDEMIRDEAGLILIWVCAFLWAYYGFARFRIVWLRWLINGCSLGPIRFYCRLDPQNASERVQRGIVFVEAVICVTFVLLFLTGGAQTGFFGEMSYTSFVWFASLVIFVAWVVSRYIHLRFILFPLTDLVLFSTAVINITAADDVVQAGPARIGLAAGIADIGYAHFL